MKYYIIFYSKSIIFFFSLNLLASTINVPTDYTTIQGALNAASNGDTILVEPGVYVENIFWPNTASLKLISTGDSSNTTIDGNATSTVIYINSTSVDTSTVIKGFNVTNGGNVQNGGGIYLFNASPKLIGLSIINNQSNNWGGGIYVEAASPIMENMMISGNNDKGVYLHSGNSILINVNITNNTGSGSGGGILISQGTPILTQVQISGNSATWGGGINIGFSNPHLLNVEIFGNNATDWGGGVDVCGNAIFENVLIKDNYTNGSGGGIIIRSNSHSIFKNVKIINNEAPFGGGGGIRVTGSNPKFENVIVGGNNAWEGGGVSFVAGSDSLSNIIIFENSARIGGGLSIGDFPYINNLTITNNNATEYGGGIYFNSGSSLEEKAIFKNLTISNNIDNLNADGIYFEDGKANFSSCNVAFNVNGVYNVDNTRFVEMINNWWGDSSGPYHPTQNTQGLGDTVNMFVNIIPYLTEPDTAAPPIPVQNIRVLNTGSDFINLNWEASPLGDLAGYKVYYSTDSTLYDYSSSIDVGNVTDYTLSGLEIDRTFYIAVTCYDIYGNESWYSIEVEETTCSIEVQNLDIGEDENQFHLVNHSPNITFDYYNSIDEPQTHYHIQVSSYENFSIIDKWDSGLFESNSTFINYIGTALEDGVTYYLKTQVKSNNSFSEWDTLNFRMNSVPSKPEILSTTDTINTLPIVLTVQANDAEDDTLSYTFNLFSNSSLTQIIKSVSGITSSSDTVNWEVDETLDDNKSYWWNSQATDGYENSDTSETGTFYVNAVKEPPLPFTLISPEQGVNGLSTTPTFKWTSSSDNDLNDQVHYCLFISSDTIMTDIIEQVITSDTTVTLSESLTDSSKYFWCVDAIDLDSLITSSDVQSFVVGFLTAIEYVNELPREFSLAQNYPNPFNPTTTINFSISKATFVELTITDILGKKIHTLVNKKLTPGVYKYDLDGTILASGVYLYMLKTKEFTQVKKMLLVK